MGRLKEANWEELTKKQAKEKYDSDEMVSHLANFSRFHEENPSIFHQVVRYADQQKQKRKRYSIEIIINVIRFWTDLKTVGEPFKINNNYKPYYARMYMQYRNCKKFFELRNSLADDYNFKNAINYYKDWLMNKECDEDAEKSEDQDNKQ